MTPTPIETDGEIRVTGDSAAGTVTLAVTLTTVDHGEFSLSMDCEAAERLAMGLGVMAGQVKHARIELAEKAKVRLN